MTISTHDGQIYEDAVDYHLDNPIDQGTGDLKKSSNYNPQTDVYQRSPEGEQAPTEQQPLDKPKQVHIVRHGETTANDDNTVRGTKIPISLNERGRQEAVEAADALKSKGVDTIVSSTLPRARETANIIGDKLGISPQFDRRLATWDVGKYEGQDCDKANPELKEYAQNKQDETPPGGESFNDFTNRSFAGIRDAVLNNKNNNVAIVTHNRVEATLRGWEKTGQDNPDIDYNEVVKESTPGNVRSITFQPTATVLKPGPAVFDQRFQGTSDFGANRGDTFNQRFEGQTSTPMPGPLPEDYENIDLSNSPWVRQLNPRPYSPEEENRNIYERNESGRSRTMPFNPEKNRDDLNLYNPIADIYDPKKVGGHVDPSEFLNPIPGSKFATTGPPPRNLSLRVKPKYDSPKMNTVKDKDFSEAIEKATDKDIGKNIPKMEMFEEKVLPDETIQRLYRNPSQQQQGRAPFQDFIDKYKYAFRDDPNSTFNLARGKNNEKEILTFRKGQIDRDINLISGKEARQQTRQEHSELRAIKDRLKELE